MVATQDQPAPKMATLTITWEKLPDDFQLKEKPVVEEEYRSSRRELLNS